MKNNNYKEPMVTINLEEYENLKLMEKAMEEGLVVKSMEFSSMNLANGIPRYCYKYTLLSQERAMAEVDKMACALKKEIQELKVKNFGLESDYNTEHEELNKVSKMSVAEFLRWRKTKRNQL